MAVLTHNLALDIQKRFFDSNREKDINIAIALHRNSLETTAQTCEAYPPLYMTHLAEDVPSRYENVTKTSADLDLVTNLHRTLLPCPSRPPDDDVQASYLSNLADVLGNDTISLTAWKT
jgi:hypothetical protein